METHAHHLHKAPGKGIWHYLFEFLMLFLAVTLGFFVENQRERYIERKREVEYIHSLCNDLKADTAILQRTIDEKVWITAKYDSAMNVLDQGTLKKNNEFIYYVSKYLSVNDVFTSQDVTYRQLLSSGSFRYISNTGLYLLIAEYYNLYSRYQAIDVFGAPEEESWKVLRSQIFDLKDYYSLALGGNFTFYDLERPARKFKPVKASKQDLKFLYRKYADAKESAIATRKFLSWLKAMAMQLIVEIEKEYPDKE